MHITPLDTLLLTVVCAGLPIWSMIGGRWYARASKSGGGRSGRYLLIAVRGMVLSALVMITWAWAGRPFSALGLDVPVGTGGRMGFLADLLVVGYYIAAVQFRRRSRSQLNATRDRLKRLRTYDMLPQTPREFAAYPIAAIVGSTCEELLYRGYLVGLLTPSLGLSAAVIGSSVLFGLGHLYQGALGVARTTIIGLAFGVGLALTHSLWWLLIAHAAANLSGILLARRILRNNS